MSEKVAEKMSTFISENRSRFSTHDDNVFAFSLSQASRYYNFLSIILARHDNALRDFLDHYCRFKAVMETVSTGELSDELRALMQEMSEPQTRLHLEIETYYLFSKILLDKTALFIQHYFGACRGKSLGSHDKLVKKFASYCQENKLYCFEIVLDLAAKLGETISDFRDKQIAHEKSPRTFRGVSIKRDVEATMTLHRIMPRDTDSQYESLPLGKLHSQIDRYILEILSFVEGNKDKTALRLQEERPIIESG